MAAIKLAPLAGSLVVMALTACATTPQSETSQVAAASAPKNAHQNPANPNPDALPKGLMEWVDYVCSIPDPEARKQAIRDSEEQRGWTFTCPEENPPQAH